MRFNSILLMITAGFLIVSCSRVSSLGPGPVVNSNTGELDEHLEIFRPYLGKTWVAKGTDEQGRAFSDVSYWERTLNGMAVRSVHSLNNGEYGGESIMFWDPESETLKSYYFTTGGFYTIGTITVEGNTFTSIEDVYGTAWGITKVRAEVTLAKDGMHSSSQYFQEGKWTEGMQFHYVADPKAKIILN